MNLEDLSAKDLRLVDEICLTFETRLRKGEQTTIESALERFRELAPEAGPKHIELLRGELHAIEQELQHEPVGKAAAGLGSSDGTTPFDASPDSVSEKFDSIGPYSVSRVVARGGMGVVYEAIDTRLDRPVAIKVIGFPDARDDKREEMIERFEREARAVAALSHPNIVELFDVGTEDGKPYAVMEYLRGHTLAEDFESGALSAAKSRLIGMQIASALATAHAGGVIHRDLKPQNIMVMNDAGEQAYRIKLVDFGLSRVSQSRWADDKSDRTRLGAILGTPGYMSPEQARGEPTRNAADIFGLGCVLYEAFFGRRAITGKTPADRLAMTLTGEVEFPSERAAEDRGLCELIERMLRKDADERPTANEIYQRFRSDLARAEGALSEREFKRALDRRTWLAAALSGLAAGAAGIGWMMNQGTRESIRSVAVMTFQSKEELAQTTSPPTSTRDSFGAAPIAGRPMSDGEAIAAALVKELSRAPDLAVRPFRPRIAPTDADVRAIAEELSVDALIRGSHRVEEQKGRSIHILSWELVSASGEVLASDEFSSGREEDYIGERLLKQEQLAVHIAARMNHVLSDYGILMDPKAYNCFVRGGAQADVDSEMGLREALKCFEKARQEGKNLVEPIGVFAVTAINLAARTGREETDERVSEAIASMQEAIRADPQAVDGLLAQAIIEWQIFYEFEDAKMRLEMLSKDYPYRSQIQYQYGMLLAAYGESETALRALRRASKLAPSVHLLKIDRCRVDWYFGDTEGALQDAMRYQRAIDGADRERSILSRGLMIDIYEHQQRWDLAAAQQGWSIQPATASQYFDRRAESLEEFPYGPFGDLLNEAILQLRRSPETASELVDDLSESRSPMFPMLVNCHPAFASMRRLYSTESVDFPTFLVRGSG